MVRQTETETEREERVSWLVRLIAGALSQVNHKGLYQGWKQTSLYLLVIHSTRLFFSNHNSNYVHNFRTQENNNTCLGAYLYSRRENLLFKREREREKREKRFPLFKTESERQREGGGGERETKERRTERVSELFGAVSPVNHKGLYQGWRRLLQRDI